MKMQISQKTSRRGLYDPRFEHDACGIGFVARLSGEPSHEIVRMALTAVGNMAHRGGVAADGKSGERARATQPVIEQALVGRAGEGSRSALITTDGYERALYLARKWIEAAAR